MKLNSTQLNSKNLILLFFMFVLFSTVNAQTGCIVKHLSEIDCKYGPIQHGVACGVSLSLSHSHPHVNQNKEACWDMPDSVSGLYICGQCGLNDSFLCGNGVHTNTQYRYISIFGNPNLRIYDWRDNVKYKGLTGNNLTNYYYCCYNGNVFACVVCGCAVAEVDFQNNYTAMVPAYSPRFVNCPIPPYKQP